MVSGHVPADHPDHLVIAIAAGTYPHSHRISFTIAS